MSTQAKDAPKVDKAAKTLTGRVVSTKMQKTISVLIQRYVPHATYGKYQRRTTQLLAHDENSESRTGDLVSIEQCRPTAVYGPRVHRMGGPDEYVEQDEVLQVAQVHLATVLDYLGAR